MEEQIKPSKSELEFLTLSYNRFYDIFEEVMSDDFFKKEDDLRLFKIKDAFAVYTELLNYEPIKFVIEQLKIHRPPMEAEIGSDLFKFIRNVISHFPFFERWDDIWINKSLVNWNKNGQSIDRFLEKYKGHLPVKYRFWEPQSKKLTYLSIGFPVHYDEVTKIYLRDFLTEREGIKFSFILMKKIIDTQVEEVELI